MKSQPGWVTWLSHHQKNPHHPILAYWGLRGVPSRGTSPSPGSSHLERWPQRPLLASTAFPLPLLASSHQNTRGTRRPARAPTQHTWVQTLAACLDKPQFPPDAAWVRHPNFPMHCVVRSRVGGWPPLFTSHVPGTLCPLSQATPGQSSERPRGGNRPSRSLTSPGSGRARICGEDGPTLEPTPPLGGHSTSQRPGLARIYKLDGLGSNSRSATHRMPATFLRLSSPICSRRRGQNTVDTLRGG